jgi:hypothetical protein
MAKSKTAKKSQAQDDKPKERRLPVPMSTHEVMAGMEIVVSTNKDGYVDKTTPIKRLETGEGCRNLHVNDTACYDRGIPINIALPETEALDRMVKA